MPKKRPCLSGGAHAPQAERNRFGSIRFGSGLFENSSVRFGQLFFPVRRASACVFVDASSLVSVRFGAVPRSVPVGSRINRLGSVRFGSVRLVRFGFLSLPAQVQSPAPKKAAKAEERAGSAERRRRGRDAATRDQGEPPVEHYLSDAGFLQQWRRM